MACIMNATINYAIAEDYVDPLITLDNKYEVMVYINQMAHEYQVSPKLMKKVINCESRYKPNAVGDGGYSFGLSQIYLPAHPNVTKEEALDPKFAIEFMAEKFSQGKARLWTCYKLV